MSKNIRDLFLSNVEAPLDRFKRAKVTSSAPPKLEPVLKPALELVKIEPKLEPKIEPKIEPKLEPKIEPAVVLLEPVTTESKWLCGPKAPIGPSLPVFAFLDDPDRDDAFCAVDFWFRKPNLEASKKPLLIIGPPGSGKTSLIHKYVPGLEAYDDGLLEDFLQSHGLRTRPVGLLDNIESLDRSERDTLRKSIGTGRRLILTSDDIFSEPAKSLLNKCTVVKLDRPRRPFAIKVMASIKNIGQKLLNDIIDSCGPETINLSVLTNAVRWLTRSKAEDRIDVHADMPMDVPKATASILFGKQVPCLGGSADISFLTMMLQLNVIQCDVPIKKLSRTLDQLSLLEIAETRYIMDTETHWSYLSLIGSSGPKVSGNKRFNLIWPKGLKTQKTPAKDLAGQLKQELEMCF